jgi:hypothetical protein
MAWLEALLTRGHGAVVLLGEPGAGATRAALEGARQAQALGHAVLCGVAMEGAAPGALFTDLLAADRRARPTPVHGAAPPSPAPPQNAVRRTLLEETRDALVAAARGRPIFLLLDDLHAADATSLELLHHLLRQAPALRLVVVATCLEEAVRAGTPLQATLAHLDTERLARGLHVPRLSLAGTREQLGDLLEATPLEPLAAAVHLATDGRPAWVEAAVATWRQSGRVPRDPRAAVRATVAALPGPTTTWLGAAARLGRRFDPRLAAALAGLATSDADGSLQAALDAGLVDDAGDAVRFHSVLAREAALAAASRGAPLVAAREALEPGAGPHRPGPAPGPPDHR